MFKGCVIGQGYFAEIIRESEGVVVHRCPLTGIEFSSREGDLISVGLRVKRPSSLLEVLAKSFVENPSLQKAVRLLTWNQTLNEPFLHPSLLAQAQHVLLENGCGRLLEEGGFADAKSRPEWAHLPNSLEDPEDVNELLMGVGRILLNRSLDHEIAQRVPHIPKGTVNRILVDAVLNNDLTLLEGWSEALTALRKWRKEYAE